MNLSEMGKLEKMEPNRKLPSTQFLVNQASQQRRERGVLIESVQPQLAVEAARQADTQPGHSLWTGTGCVEREGPMGVRSAIQR